MQFNEHLQKKFRQRSEHIKRGILSMMEDFYTDGQESRFDYTYAVDTMYDMRSWAEEAIGILEEMKEKEEKEPDET